MFLERIEVKGFRGINRLSLGLDNTTVLIGENAWGKSSLLRALWCLLGQDAEPYQFSSDDFHQPEDPELEPARHLQLVLTFSEHRPQMCLHSRRLARLGAAWVKHKDKFHRIHYRASAELQSDGSVTTTHDFLDGIGKSLPIDDAHELVCLLITMNPVFRLRDARTARNGVETLQWGDLSEHRLSELADKLIDEPQRIGEPELKEALQAVRQLMDHYFNALAPIKNKPRSQREIVNRPMTLRNPGNLQALLRNADNRALQLAMAGMAATLLQARGNRELEQGARPIMILEDPESRLHPTMLALAWGLLEQLPGQKLLTTNSGTCYLRCPSTRSAGWCAASRTSSAISWGASATAATICARLPSMCASTAPCRCLPAAGCWWRGRPRSGCSPSLPRSAATACGRKGCGSSSSPSAASLRLSRWRGISASSGICSPTATRRGSSTPLRPAPCSRASESGIA